MSKIYRNIVAGAITAIVLFLVWYFSAVVAYILTSAVLAMIGKPMTDMLCRIHIGRTKIPFPKWLAALCTLLTIWKTKLVVAEKEILLNQHNLRDLPNRQSRRLRFIYCFAVVQNRFLMFSEKTKECRAKAWRRSCFVNRPRSVGQLCALHAQSQCSCTVRKQATENKR